MSQLPAIKQLSRAEKWFYFGLLFWIFTQISRLVAIPLLQAILDDGDPDAWFYPAVLDLFAADRQPRHHCTGRSAPDAC